MNKKYILIIATTVYFSSTGIMSTYRAFSSTLKRLIIYNYEIQEKQNIKYTLILPKVNDKCVSWALLNEDKVLLNGKLFDHDTLIYGKFQSSQIGKSTLLLIFYNNKKEISSIYTASFKVIRNHIIEKLSDTFLAVLLGAIMAIIVFILKTILRDLFKKITMFKLLKYNLEITIYNIDEYAKKHNIIKLPDWIYNPGTNDWSLFLIKGKLKIVAQNLIQYCEKFNNNEINYVNFKGKLTNTLDEIKSIKFIYL